MVNEGLWIGLEVANTPASHLQSAARAIDYLHRTFDVIPEVDATSALSEFSRMRREGQLYNLHEAFVNEVPMYAELRRARPRLGADMHELLRWQQWARRYRNAPFSAELGSHNAPPAARGTHYTFPAGSDNVCLAPLGATRPRVPAASSVNVHHLSHATHLATHDPTCPSRTSLLKGGDVVLASGPTIWTSTYGLEPVLCNRLLIEPSGWAQTVLMFTQRFM